jgi:predicted RNA binding protein YcfA (HicA-like mRNA interferase family)
MAIDYSSLRSLTARKLIRALKKDGFREYKRKGVTRFFAHPEGRTTTIHLHNMNQTFAIGTLKAIIEQQVQWTEDDLKRLGLLK